MSIADEREKSEELMHLMHNRAGTLQWLEELQKCLNNPTDFEMSIRLHGQRTTIPKEFMPNLDGWLNYELAAGAERLAMIDAKLIELTSQLNAGGVGE